MRKLKEVLRLQAMGLSQHQIARSCSISQSTVHEYVSAAQAAGVKWPLPENWNDQQIEQALFPQRPVPEIWRKHAEPDWPQIHQELQTHKDLTLQLVWQEGRETDEHVTHVTPLASHVFRAVRKQLRHGAYAASTLYGDGLVSGRIAEGLVSLEPYIQKRLHYIYDEGKKGEPDYARAWDRDRPRRVEGHLAQEPRAAAR